MSDEAYLDPDFLDESSKSNIEDYICCICQFIPNPETALEEENCGHLFCEKCISKWLVKSQKCPFCKEIISKRSVKDKNKIVYRQLINLIVLCQEENCQWKGMLKEYDEHLDKKHNKKKISYYFELYKYYKATCHEHPLKYLDTTMDNGWTCDGRNLTSKCLSGITGFKQTKDIKRFRCMQCDYDLCELCMKNYYDINYQNKNDDSDNRGLYLLNKLYYTKVHKHPLVFLDKTLDNGWICNGGKLKKKCFSGITDFKQTFGIPRFRCQKCDFDLCEKCMDNYKCIKNYELNKSYKISTHPHPLKYVDKIVDKGWTCNGRYLKDKCLSGFRGIKQTKEFKRFRCEECTFDLCKNCMDYYYFHDNKCIIF